MLVSAVSANNIQTVFSTRIKNQDSAMKEAFKVVSETPENVTEEKNSIFDSINEWKYFCHEQILKGKMDIIA